MKPIHFRPNPAPSARNSAAQEAYRSNQGPGVAAVVRSATSIKQPVSTERERRVQLEDYVNKIRQTANDTGQPGQPEVVFRTQFQGKEEAVFPSLSPDAQTAPESDPSPEIDYPAEPTSFTFVRQDAAHIQEQQQTNSKTVENFNNALQKLRGPHIKPEQFPADGYQAEQARRLDADYQRKIIDDIGVAIASALTDLPVEQLKDKLPAEPDVVTEANQAPEAASVIEAVESPDDSTQDSLSRELPFDAAAWDVEDFRWQALSNQMIATASNAMQQLFDQLLAVSNEDTTRPSNRLAVTGAGRGEGTSTIAISLARWAAACGKSVLLVDADINSPSLTQQVGLQHGLSWLNAIERNDDPAEVIIRSQKTNLCVMPMAPIDARSDYPRRLFDALGPFLGKVESHFDWIVMDFGPGSQLLSELSRPELLIDSALLIGSSGNQAGLNSLQSRLESLGLDRFVLAENSVRHQEAA